MPTKLWLPYRIRAVELSKKATVAEPTPEARRARDDFAWFGKYVQGVDAMPHHQVWIDALVTNKDSSQLKKVAGPNTAILAPRGSGKSTWYGLFVAWVLGHNPDCQIIYCSYSENVALSRSRLIQRIIQSEKYRQVFPEILPGKRFSATDWEIDKSFSGVTDLESDYSFLAVGAGGSITSKRSKLIIIDDPQKSSDSIANPEVREKLETNWNEVLRPTLIPGGRVIAVGTRFRADDLFATTYIKEKGWNVIEQSAIIEDSMGIEQSYWSQRYPIEELRMLRESSPVSFSFQFMNRIIRISETSIDPDWIVRGEVPTDPEQFDSLAIGLDLSAGEREVNDFTAFVLGGRIGDRFYILDMRRGRWAGNIDKLNILLDMCVDWGILDVQEVNGEKKYEQLSTTPLILFAEDTQYQASLAADFKHYIINKYKIYNLIYRPSPTKGKDKLARLRGVSGLFQNKMIVFNQYRALGRLVEELTNFNAINHEDVADAAIHLLVGITGRPKLDAA